MSDQSNEQRPQVQLQPAAATPTSNSAAPVQLQRELAGLPYAQQVERVRPPMPIIGHVSNVQSKGSEAVQMEGDDPGRTSFVKAAAGEGIKGTGSQLPHFDTIQQSFGQHDISGVKAHTGESATRASQAMGAAAYTTGSDVAFKGSPDLHTAAHEAAHTIQQSHGVSLSGGVGQVGDRYEKHADAVADAVVSGHSAAPLLDRMSPVHGRFDGSVQGLFDRMVQMVAGENYDTAPLDPEIRLKAVEALKAKGMTDAEIAGLVTVAQFVDALAGNPPDVQREQYTKNNQLKVEFEVELAKALVNNPGEFREVVEGVSKNIYEYFRTKKDMAKGTTEVTIKSQVEKMCGMYGFLKTDKPMPEILYGRITDAVGVGGGTSPDEDIVETVVARVMRIMRDGGGTISNHIYAHHQFMDNIYANDFYGKGEIATVTAQQILDQMDGHFKAIEPKYQRALVEGNPFGVIMPDGTPASIQHDDKGKIMEDSAKRGRTTKSVRAQESQRASGGPTSAIGIATGDTGGVRDLSPDQQTQEHGRGIDLYELDESQKFAQEARVLYDMPLAAGVSGTTTDLLECALTFGVSKGTPEAFKYTLGCLTQLMAAGAHSFHEIMTAATTAGVAYEPGNYRSILQHDFKGVEDLFEPDFMGGKFANVPGIKK